MIFISWFLVDSHACIYICFHAPLRPKDGGNDMVVLQPGSSYGFWLWVHRDEMVCESEAVKG